MNVGNSRPRGFIPGSVSCAAVSISAGITISVRRIAVWISVGIVAVGVIAIPEWIKERITKPEEKEVIVMEVVMMMKMIAAKVVEISACSAEPVETGAGPTRAETAAGRRAASRTAAAKTSAV